MAESKSAALPLGDAPIRRSGHGPAESGRTIVLALMRCNGLGGDFAPSPIAAARSTTRLDGNWSKAPPPALARAGPFRSLGIPTCVKSILRREHSVAENQ